MQTEKKIGKFERFYESLKEWTEYSSSGKILLSVISIVLGAIFLILMTQELHGGFQNVFDYSEKECQYLETEIQKVIVDNEIDMTAITDERISWTKKEYFDSSSNNEESWSCEIEVSKEKHKVNGTVTESKDGSLKMKTTYLSKDEYTRDTTIQIILVFVFLSGITGIIIIVLFSVFYFIVFLLRCIEVHKNKKLNN